MTAKEEYIKSYEACKALFTLNCRAVGANPDTLINLLQTVCSYAIEYGRQTKHVLDDINTASNFPQDN